MHRDSYEQFRWIIYRMCSLRVLKLRVQVRGLMQRDKLRKKVSSFFNLVFTMNSIKLKKKKIKIKIVFVRGIVRILWANCFGKILIQPLRVRNSSSSKNLRTIVEDTLSSIYDEFYSKTRWKRKRRRIHRDFIILYNLCIRIVFITFITSKKDTFPTNSIPKR